MKTIRLFALCILSLLLLAPSPTWAQDGELQEEIHFAPGKSGITLTRGIARGESIRFLLDAGAGQTMTVKVTSVESNAVFEVLGDGGPLGNSVAKGKAQVWSGKLPIKGTYAVIVGSERGGSEFTLTITIK